MDLISNMGEPMDEVLLSSVVEACVRIREPEFFSIKLEQPMILPAAATLGHLLQPSEVPRRPFRGA